MKSGYGDLVNEINSLIKSEVNLTVESKIKKFEELGQQTKEEIFLEMCFCILTANFQAERGVIIHKAIERGFLTLNEKNLARKLKELGYRFPNTRSQYIVESRAQINQIYQLSILEKPEIESREWLVHNIKGLGMKESSHFLRNIGFKDLAIIDFHIIDLLEKYEIISKPITMTKNKYLEIEGILRDIAHKLELYLAQLDLFLWFIETGKIIK
ncbi:MAG: N-glycosylase/DNA lyase [Asgard group archaeon]|nr:N-glycosylase/DNA lyase [Asgard group archaeon]